MSDQQGRTQVHYIHRLDYSARERLVGLFVLIAVAILIALILVKGRASHLFEEQITYHAFLQNVQGVAVDSLVHVSGIEVGRVVSLDISQDNRIHITFFVYESFRRLIREDSHGSLGKLAIVGDSSLEISAGNPDLPELAAGSIIDVEEPLTVDELISQLTPIFEKVNRTFEGVAAIVAAIDPEKIQATSGELGTMVERLNLISGRIVNGQGLIGKALYDKKFENDVTLAVNKLGASMVQVERRLIELEPVVKNFDAVSDDGKQVAKELQQLLVDSRRLVGEMNQAVHSVNIELQQLPEIVSRMQLLLESTDRTLDGVQRVWPISSAIRPVEGGSLLEVRPFDE